MTNYFLILISLFTLIHPNIKLNIIIKNIQVGKGNIDIAIYNDKNNFFKKPFAEETKPASAENMVFSFDLPAGEYAAAAYQDINKNKKLDKGIFSIPTEPYGLSNNYRPIFSTPAYDDCKFGAIEDKTIIIKLE